MTPGGQSPSSLWRRYQRVLTPIFLLLPAVVLFAVFVVYPLLETVRLSFYAWDGIGTKTWVGFNNYRELIADPVFHVAIRNNFIWLSLFAAAPVAGLFIALLLSESVSGIRIIRPLFFAPFVISQVVVGLVFAWVLHGEFGLLKVTLDFFGVPGAAPLASERWSIYAIVLAGLWPQIAYCTVLYLTALTTVRSDLLAAARSDGARGWRLILYVVLPQLRPVTFVVLLVCIVSALRSFDLVMVMTGGGPYDQSTVLALYMYEQAFGSFRFGYAAAIATVLLMIMMIAIAYFLRRLVRREAY